MNDFIYDESPLPRDPGGMIEKIINIIGTVVIGLEILQKRQERQIP